MEFGNKCKSFDLLSVLFPCELFRRAAIKKNVTKLKAVHTARIRSAFVMHVDFKRSKNSRK